VAKIRKFFRANPLAIDPPGRKISKTESANSNMGPAPASGQEWGSSNENENFTRHPFHSTWPISTGRKILVKNPRGDSKAMHIIMSWAQTDMIRRMIRWNPDPNLGGRSSMGLF
jgi:hypothetical protein